MEINFFTPGQLRKSRGPLAAYRSPTPVGALEPYLEAYTQPGDLVIDLFCQGPSLVHEAFQTGRRALGVNVNRALLLAASLGLTDVEGRAVEAAFTQLAETRKGTDPLQAHVEGLYRTACTTCGATTIAEAFIWERESLVAKRYRCDRCGDAGAVSAGAAPVREAAIREAPADEADRATIARFDNRSLSYWLLLDRAAPSNAPHRERVAALLELYTPRNLAAVNDILLKLDGLTLAPPVRRTLDGLLLDVLDQATSLRAPDAFDSRPRRLRRPGRYVEANVWRLLERALERWRETVPTPVPNALTLDALLAAGKTTMPTSPSAAPISIHLAPMSTIQAAQRLPAGSAALIVVDPPRPDTVLWHLSALWCHWLWGSQAGAQLTSILSRRWLDKEWLWRGLRGALRTVAPLLGPAGRLVCLLADENPVILEALTLAASGSGYDLIGWGMRPPGDVRLNWQFSGALTSRPGTQPPPPSTGVDSFSRAVAQRVADAAPNLLRARGEPLDWPTLHAAVFADLAESGLLARAATMADDDEAQDSRETLTQPLSWLNDTIRSTLDGAPLRQMTNRVVDQQTTPPLWWLDEPLESEADAPLSDRVELAVAEMLRDLLAVTEEDLHRRVCARFPGHQTPDAKMIRLCLFSYGDEHAPGHWRLRAEDDLAARVAETDAVVADLRALGGRLGFQVTLGAPSAGEWAVRWVDETGHTPYAFSVRTTAVLGDVLFAPPLALWASPPLAGGKEGGRATERKTIPCLTLPGGRAVLVGYKLRRDPRLREHVARRGWQFLKFRHLRHLAQEVAAKQLDRYAFQAALGLDPIVEQEEAQLSLW